jgi:hypothetical protein
MELALINFHKALEIERNNFGEEHPTCARTLNEIGNIQMQRGNVKELMDNYTQAARIYRKAGMPDDHLVVFGTDLFRFEIVQPDAAGAA